MKTPEEIEAAIVSMVTQEFITDSGGFIHPSNMVEKIQALVTAAREEGAKAARAECARRAADVTSYVSFDRMKANWEWIFDPACYQGQYQAKAT